MDFELINPIELYSEYAKKAQPDKMYDLFSKKSTVKTTMSREDYIQSLQRDLNEAFLFAEYPSKFEVLSKKINQEKNLALLKIKYLFNNKNLEPLYEYFILSFEENRWKIVEKSENELTFAEKIRSPASFNKNDIISVELGLDFFFPEKKLFLVTLKGNFCRGGEELVNVVSLLLNTDKKRVVDGTYKPNLTIQQQKGILNHFSSMEFEESSLDELRDSLQECEGDLRTDEKRVNAFLKYVMQNV